jgi:opacity protein-like surface antigen
MKIASKILLCLLFCVSQASAQLPAAAGVGPAMDVSLGYSYMRSGTPSSTGIGLSGVDASLTEGITPRFSLRTDLGYLRASNVFGTGYHNDVLSYLVGPVFYPRRDRRLVTCVYGLAGGARVTGVFPRGAQYGRGFVNNFSWAFGGGYEYWLSESMALRVSVDALHTSFFNASGVIQGRYDLRPVAGVVYYFGGRKR